MKLRTVLLLICTSLVISMAGCQPLAAATRHVVLLYDERVELPGLSRLDEEIIQTLRSQLTEPIEIYREVMDLSRFESESYKTLLRDFLQAKYATKKIDVAVAVLPTAFDFLSAYGDVIFPGTPIVFCGLDRAQLSTRRLLPNMAGVLIKREFAPTLDLAFRLHPGTNRVVVVSGTSEFDAKLQAQAQSEFRLYEDRVQFTYLSDLPLDQLLKRLSQLPDGNVALFTTLFQDGVGQPFVTHDVVEQVSKASRVPVYGFLDQYLGRGIVGGSLYSTTALGIETGKIVSRVLTGTLRSQEISEPANNKVIFDWRQILRWGLNEQDLPHDAEIRFREPTVWQSYRWHISAAGALFFLQAILITGLLLERQRRRYAELQSRNRLSELAHANRFSMAGEFSASIAHELSQPLTAILTNAEALQLMLKSPAPDMAEFGEIVTSIRQDDLRASQVIDHLRGLLKKAPFERKSVDLNEIVREAIDFASVKAKELKVAFRCTYSPMQMTVSGDRIQLQQVMLNLIINAIDAMVNIPPSDRQVRIGLARRENFAEVSVADAGPGIPLERLNKVFQPFFTTKGSGMGLGLSIARRIIEAHNGAIWVESQAGAGAVFRIRLPLG